MPPKKIAPPIDRPLSKAYLRKFSGWSTAYPPGLSEPNSLRIMENVMVTRDGAARVRPGLRSVMREATSLPLVGSHELFYDEDGSKGYLVAVRDEVNERVEFRVMEYVEQGDEEFYELVDLETAGFELPADPTTVSFTLATTYVKYLQIDNKIFALSNADDPLVMFWVGTDKRAQRMTNIERPSWEPQDKLTAVHPDGGWVDGSAPATQRLNRIYNPDFITSAKYWAAGNSKTSFWRSTITGPFGKYGVGLASKHERLNYCRRPLHDVASTGTSGWTLGPRCFTIRHVSGSMRVRLKKQDKGSFGYTMSEKIPVPGGARLRIAFDLAGSSNIHRWMTAVRFFKGNGDRIGATTQSGGNRTLTPGRKYSKEFTVPSQARYMRILIGGTPTGSGVIPTLDINDVYLGNPSNSARLSGNLGSSYYWEGAANASRSVYHPPQDIYIKATPTNATAGTYYASAYARQPNGDSRTVEVQARPRNSSGTVLTTKTGSATDDASWQRVDSGALVAPAGTKDIEVRLIVRAVPRDEVHYFDAVQLESGSLGDYFSGAYPANTDTRKQRWTGAAHESRSWSETFNPIGSTNPNAETPTSSTLLSSSAAANVYNFGFFYTISNELGESAESQVTVIKVQRPHGDWKWTKPSGGSTSDPRLTADQLVVYMPQDVFDAAVAAGATKWTAYYASWSAQDPPAVTAIKFAEIDLREDSEYGRDSYAVLTPEQVRIGDADPVMPSEQTRFNSTDPSRGTQGLVAADRMILVGDPSDPAMITWSSGAPGDYHNFSPQLGGGQKQLTTGNMYVTACIKLWQNPQSVDTLTILTMGDDGRSNGYYMEPAQITTLSETVNVMGFEEITNMPGTSAPYGCEVLNNGLYHPLKPHLLKSTANNYNISHRTMTDKIENLWRVLQYPHRIVSSVLDNRIYYLVHNILGDVIEEGCQGNEIWVMDVGAKTETWSRFTVQGASLRAMEFEGKLMMSVIRPDGIFVLDPDRSNDETFDAVGTIEMRNISWFMESNTQGANRAHDAWCSLQQANVTFGNFQGQLRYGIRGKDINGMPVDITKEVYAEAPPWDGLDIVDETDTGDDQADDTVLDEDSRKQLHLPTIAPFDREDYFLIARQLKEWVFFAGSIEDEEVLNEGEENEEEVLVSRFSGGQINYVQYRYTPITVNVGYEYGSVETFEYGASDLEGSTTDSGTPQPYTDMARP